MTRALKHRNDRARTRVIAGGVVASAGRAILWMIGPGRPPSGTVTSVEWIITATIVVRALAACASMYHLLLPVHWPRLAFSGLTQSAMIKAIIFDLDNCLSAADESSRQLLEPVFDAVRQCNHGTLSDDDLEHAFDECWRDAFDVVASRYGFSHEMLEAGWAAAAQAEVKMPLQGYPDLGALRALPGKLFLVTSGFRRLQESKISALRIAELFAEVHVDAIDEKERRGKRRIFADILTSHQLTPDEVLVVGDNPDSEIEAGNQLGITTVQILRPGVTRGKNAAFYIDELGELAQLV